MVKHIFLVAMIKSVATWNVVHACTKDTDCTGPRQQYCIGGACKGNVIYSAGCINIRRNVKCLNEILHKYTNFPLDYGAVNFSES